jgi:hypothetical protein
MRIDVVIGIIVAVLAAVELWAMSQIPPKQASSR